MPTLGIQQFCPLCEKKLDGDDLYPLNDGPGISRYESDQPFSCGWCGFGGLIVYDVDWDDGDLSTTWITDIDGEIPRFTDFEKEVVKQTINIGTQNNNNGA